ncbi:serine O-acetyltransferase [Roseospira marina]|uniref:Serine acetyltransferase n=1 Tax=Roseospira marina TaxID=140057 RepID=A0A5M6IBS1_9PROT|nr:serine O-acetyltransferase [Roseospira marina]KAA5605562.1 serine O-acetyltransferase [Roseospira marina]MBB4313375.1 serine O-acetyltransferase [Roseospira marina]MBB5085884.1 serine O-acetyltransferase [Roseospira marina]
MAFARLREDINTILQKDPAARSRMEVLLCYPGLHAVMFHRLSNPLWRRGLRFWPRLISHIGKLMTGVEIHPGATLGRRLFIDHATGVVIGETAEVGDDVTLYHGVTLGGTSLHQGKRHPTLRDGVIVGSGGQVLGPITIGAEARVGANAVVLSDVPSGATVVGIPARVVRRDKVDPAHHCEFQAYGTPTDGITDPMARTLTGLTDQIGRLAAQVADLERRLKSTGADAEPDTATQGYERADAPGLVAMPDREMPPGGGMQDGPRRIAGRG